MWIGGARIIASSRVPRRGGRSRFPANDCPDETSARSDLAAKLYECVDALETDLRDTIHLHYYQELTLQETADALGIATSTVKYRLRHALAELQKNAAEDFGSTKPRFNTKAV